MCGTLSFEIINLASQLKKLKVRFTGLLFFKTILALVAASSISPGQVQLILGLVLYIFNFMINSKNKIFLFMFFSKMEKLKYIHHLYIVSF